MTTPAASDRRPEPSGRRAELLEGLTLAGRASSVATVIFHTAVAAHQGLNATEEKALDLLERSGPLTAGELARQTRLAPASAPRPDPPAGGQGLRPACPQPRRPAQRPGRGRRRAPVRPGRPPVRRLGPLPR